MKRIGFTGTEKGMTKQQYIKLDEYLRYLHKVISPELHHGDCIGADEQFHNKVSFLFGTKLIYIHPSTISDKRAYCRSPNILLPKPPLQRNHDIVDAINLIIATPKGYHEILRSGTWATIRYARKTNKLLHIILPNGKMI